MDTRSRAAKAGQAPRRSQVIDDDELFRLMKLHVTDPSFNDDWVDMDAAAIVTKYEAFLVDCAKKTTLLNWRPLKSIVVRVYAEGPAGVDMMDLWARKLSTAYNAIGTATKNQQQGVFFCKAQRAVAAQMRQQMGLAEQPQTAPAAPVASTPAPSSRSKASLKTSADD